MRAYVAGRFTGQARIKVEAQRLRDLGWKINASWLDSVENDVGYSVEDGQRYANRDLDEILSADILVLDTLDESTTGGREVEFGYAYACDKGLVVVGPHRNVFHYLEPVFHFDSWDEFISYVEAIPK